MTNTFDSFNHIKLVILLISAVLLLLMIAFSNKTHFVSDSKLLLLFTLFGASLIVHFFVDDARWQIVFFGAFGRALGIGAYFAFVIFMAYLSLLNTTKVSEVFIQFFGNLGVVLTLYGFMQITDNDFFAWNNPNMPLVLTVGNSNFASALLALTGIANFSRVILSMQANCSSIYRLYLIFVLGAQIYLILISDAIQGLIAFIIGASVFLTALYKKKIASFKIWMKILAISIIGLLIWFFFNGINGMGPFSGFLENGLRSIKDRAFHWQTAIDVFSDFPVFGVGMDKFGDWYPQYRSPEAIEFRGVTDQFTNNAHNVPLQLLSTGGLVTFVPYVLLLLTIGKFAWLILSRDRVNSTAIAVVSIWIAFLIQSLVSIDQIGLAIWGWIAGGIVINIGRREKNLLNSSSSSKFSTKIHKTGIEQRKERELLSRKVISSLIVMALAPSIVLFVFPVIVNDSKILSEIKVFRSLSVKEDSQYEMAKSDSVKLLVNLGSESTHPNLRGLIMQELAARNFTSEAQNLAILTTKEFPRYWYAWNFLSEIYEQGGNFRLALETRKAQLAIDPNNPTLLERLKFDEQQISPKSED